MGETVVPPTLVRCFGGLYVLLGLLNLVLCLKLAKIKRILHLWPKNATTPTRKIDTGPLGSSSMSGSKRLLLNMNAVFGSRTFRRNTQLNELDIVMHTSSVDSLLVRTAGLVTVMAMLQAYLSFIEYSLNPGFQGYAYKVQYVVAVLVMSVVVPVFFFIVTTWHHRRAHSIIQLLMLKAVRVTNVNSYSQAGNISPSGAHQRPTTAHVIPRLVPVEYVRLGFVASAMCWLVMFWYLFAKCDIVEDKHLLVQMTSIFVGTVVSASLFVVLHCLSSTRTGMIGLAEKQIREKGNQFVVRHGWIVFVFASLSCVASVMEFWMASSKTSFALSFATMHVGLNGGLNVCFFGFQAYLVLSELKKHSRPKVAPPPAIAIKMKTNASSSENDTL